MFVTDLVGYIVGDHAKVLKTIDGGQSWADQNAIMTGVNTIGGVYFLTEQTGYIYGFNFFKKTVDGGLNWTDVQGYAPWAGIPFQIQEVDFLTPLIGYASGDAGFLIKTIDDGQTWTQINVIIPSYVTESLFDFEFLENHDNYGFACGYHGLVIRTYDGGTTWELMNSDIPGTNQVVNHASTFTCMDFRGNKGFMGYQSRAILTYEEVGLSISELKDKKTDLKLFPNPVNSELFFSAELNNINKIEIYNIQGQLMFKNVNVISNYVSCDNLAPGSYFLKVTTNSNVVSKQFIKE